LKSSRTWAELHFSAELWDLAGQVGHLSGLGIHLNDRLVAQIERVNEPAIRPIKLPEDAELSHFENALGLTDTHQDSFDDFVHILGLAGKVLLIPLDLSGFGIQRECRVCI